MFRDIHRTTLGTFLPRSIKEADMPNLEKIKKDIGMLGLYVAFRKWDLSEDEEMMELGLLSEEERQEKLEFDKFVLARKEELFAELIEAGILTPGTTRLDDAFNQVNAQK
jgi:hypothetical protein